MEWFMANLANIVLICALAVLVFFIIRSMVRNKKAGKTSCGGNCGHCAMCGACHMKTDNKL